MGEDKDGWASIFSAELEDTLIDQTWHQTTRSGGDHFVFADPGNVYLAPNQNHTTPDGTTLQDVDRRAGSSYFIAYSDAPESRDAFAPAPAWLLTPAIEPETHPYRGTVDDWLARCPKGEPSPLVAAWVDTIPADITHQQMIEAQRQLVGWATEGESGIPWAIERFRSAYLAGSWDTREYNKAWADGLRGAIKKYGAFPPGPRDIGLNDDFIALANGIKAAGFTDVFTSLPPSLAKDAMRERVGYIASVALSEGLSLVDAANLAWASAAAREGIRKKLAEDDAKVEIWNVVMEALARPVEEETPTLPDAPEPVEQTPSKRPVELLSVRERAALDHIKSAKWGEQYRWWGDQFMDVMGKLLPVMSEPYYRLNRWVLLSLIFSNRAVIQFESGSRIILNIYAINLGPSNSGKSEALEPVLEVARMFYEHDDDPDIGGDSTSAGLTQALIRRDGLTSLFHSDEADSILFNWSNQSGEFRGMKQRITEVYNGRVPAIQRAMAKELSGIHARAYLSVHLIGIDDKITDAISPEDWKTGFINRFVWAEGERKHRTDEMRRLRVARPGQKSAAAGQPLFFLEWVNKFRILKSHIGNEGTPGPVLMDINDDVLDRHVETGKRLEAIALAQGAYTDRVDPTFRRIEVYVLKCAALVALSEDRRAVQMSDYLIALEQVEEWAANALEMVRRTDLTPRARRVNRLAELLRAKGGRMVKSEIFREEAYAGDARDAEGLIKELEAQRRAEVIPAGEGRPEPIVRLIGGVE